MQSKKYKIGKIIIKVVTPCEYIENEPFSFFLTENGTADYIVKYDFVESLPPKINGSVFTMAEQTYAVNDKKVQCYYKNHDLIYSTKEFYACRESDVNSKECTIHIIKDFKDYMWSRLLFSVMGLEEIAVKSDAVIIHSSLVNENGKALLFTGPCGMGKSTQAALWNKYRNAEIINGDKAMLYEKEGKVYASSIPFAGSSNICKSKELEISSFIQLGKAKENIAVKRQGVQAFIDVLRSCYPLPYSKELSDMQAEVVEKIYNKFNVYKFDCLADESAVNYLDNILNKTKKSIL